MTSLLSFRSNYHPVLWSRTKYRFVLGTRIWRNNAKQAFQIPDHSCQPGAVYLLGCVASKVQPFFPVEVCISHCLLSHPLSHLPCSAKTGSTLGLGSAVKATSGSPNKAMELRVLRKSPVQNSHYTSWTSGQKLLLTVLAHWLSQGLKLLHTKLAVHGHIHSYVCTTFYELRVLRDLVFYVVLEDSGRLICVNERKNQWYQWYCQLISAVPLCMCARLCVCACALSVNVLCKMFRPSTVQIHKYNSIYSGALL